MGQKIFNVFVVVVLCYFAWQLQRPKTSNIVREALQKEKQNEEIKTNYEKSKQTIESESKAINADSLVSYFNDLFKRSNIPEALD